MPQSCVVVGCSQRAHPSSGVSFFVFPKEDDRRRAWISAVNRKDWQPKLSSRVCSRHFLGGRPYPFSPAHPDYAPCLELSSFHKQNDRLRSEAELRLSRFNRTAERRRTVERQYEWPFDHKDYSLPPDQFRRRVRSVHVSYPPVHTGKLRCHVTCRLGINCKTSYASLLLHCISKCLFFQVLAFISCSCVANILFLFHFLMSFYFFIFSFHVLALPSYFSHYAH